MKIQCEVVVLSVLPLIRKELARELVGTHGMTQAEVARKFDVTDAAISQYLKRKRGGNEMIESSPHYPVFMEAVRQSAEAIAVNGSEYACEMCRLCGVVKKSGLLNEIFMKQQGTKAPECDCNMSLVRQ